MNGLLAATANYLLAVARDLTEPDEPNAEYIRGQVNLIMDAVNLSGDHRVYEWFTAIISHREELPTARTIRIVTNARGY
jgi:hypothetical protein